MTAKHNLDVYSAHSILYANTKRGEDTYNPDIAMKNKKEDHCSTLLFAHS